MLLFFNYLLETKLADALKWDIINKILERARVVTLSLEH